MTPDISNKAPIKKLGKVLRFDENTEKIVDLINDLRRPYGTVTTCRGLRQ